MTAPYYADESVTLHLGDCLDVLAAMEACSVDAVVTDPPYGLEFMGKDWDAPWQAGIGIGEHNAGFSPGAPAVPGVRGEIKALPSFTGSTNPTCRNCGGTRNGNDRQSRRRCRCERPEFPNTTLPRMRAFQAWCEAWATECLRVLKPGGHLLAFGGTRTWHRLVCGIEDAGFEVRDAVADLTGYDAPGLMWVYGSGFPKSLDVSKAIDKAAGMPREIIGTRPQFPDGTRGARARPNASPEVYGDRVGLPGEIPVTAPATEDAARWEGWGTALKPGWEPIAVGRKPLAGTVAGNVLEWGTGALNIDGCRVDGAADNARANKGGYLGYNGGERPDKPYTGDAGRWPPNVVLGPAAAAGLDRQSGTTGPSLITKPAAATPDERAAYGKMGAPRGQRGHPDAGGASRFFPVFRYEAKAAASERPRSDDGTAHPTVKPVDLMRWLVRLVTPPGGLVLDPFAGSGTTAEACIVEGFRCVLAEKDPASAELIVKRLGKPIQPVMFGLDAS